MATILIVDDDPVAQRVLSAQLRRAGHLATAARSGEAAVKLLGESTFNLVILDLGLPDMDGLTLLRMLRADLNIAKIPVIILTASGQNDDCIEAEAAGASAFLLKPTSSSELIETVTFLLG